MKSSVSWRKSAIVSRVLCAGALSCWNMKLCNLEWKWTATIIVKYCWRRSCYHASRKYRVTISYSNGTVNSAPAHRARLISGMRDSPPTFQVSQGSAATDLRWGENFNKFLFCNSFLNIVVKKLRKSVNICQSYRKNKSLVFMDHSVHYIQTTLV